LELLTLGIGSASVHLERFPSAQLLSIDTELVLIDCGEGTQYRLLEYKAKLRRLKHIFISHLHGDHYQGLVGLLSSINMAKRTEKLQIFGPKGLKELIQLHFFYADTRLGFELAVHVIDTETELQIFENSNFSVIAFPLRHRVPCYGYRFEEKAKQLKILIDSLPLDFPTEGYKALREGKDYLDKTTAIVYSHTEYTLKENSTGSFAHVSDTIYDPSIVQFISGVDLLYHEATFTDEHESRAAVTFHTTARQAGQIAQKAGVKKLLLGHFSSRYKTLEAFLIEAQSVFPETQLAEQGKTVII
jgi:ribonuclease Z